MAAPCVIICPALYIHIWIITDGSATDIGQKLPSSAQIFAQNTKGKEVVVMAFIAMPPSEKLNVLPHYDSCIMEKTLMEINKAFFGCKNIRLNIVIFDDSFGKKM